MAYAFFTAWGAYPILWAIGPEGFQQISGYANTIAHTFCDILAKELWTFLGHTLRIKVRGRTGLALLSSPNAASAVVPQ